MVKSAKNRYIIPNLTVVEFYSERGFAASNVISNTANNLNREVGRLIAIDSTGGDNLWSGAIPDGQSVFSRTAQGNNTGEIAAGHFTYEDGGWF